jgi:hypothetical protein
VFPCQISLDFENDVAVEKVDSAARQCHTNVALKFNLFDVYPKAITQQLNQIGTPLIVMKLTRYGVVHPGAVYGHRFKESHCRSSVGVLMPAATSCRSI